MSLKEYKKKRNFGDSPEPKANDKNGKADPLRFVVQRHHASRLHYDFRLEMKGVLKSWAVPKGPSLDPEDKRLAMMVEDHPYDYKDFEGMIPEGNYGAGTVYKWDEGFYRPVRESADPEKELFRELRAGSLKFVLHGKKLKGEFALVRMQGREDNSWLLIKHRDKFARENYNSEDFVPKRVKEKGNGRSRAPKKSRAGQKTRPAREEGAAGGIREAGEPAKTRKAAKAGADASWTKPMLARLTDRPFTREGWLFEKKWDGYRAIAEVSGESVRLYSRNNKSFLTDYPGIPEALRKIPHELILDGEITVLGKDGRPDFQLLQNYRSEKKGKLVYYVFDLLALDGYDLTGMELVARRELLDEFFRNFRSGVILNTTYVLTEGEAYFKKIQREKGEGIMAKLGSSSYSSGRRSDAWLKIKTHHQQEAVIAGFTAPRGSRKKFGALILGIYEGKQLRYIGHTGGGFNTGSLEAVYKKMQPLIQKECPFETRPKTNAPATWVKPKLVCEVKFAEWTGGGHMRQPIFVALRTDKPAEKIVREQPVAPPATGPASSPAKTAKTSPARTAKTSPAKTAKTMEKKKSVKAGNRNVQLTNLDKLYWPKEKISKGDLIAYYREIAPYLLPYLKDRPQSLHRHPEGIGEPGFFQKDFTQAGAPSWIRTVAVYSESTGKDIDYVICNNEATLLYLVNLGCIELNPWLSRVPRLDRPDFIAIDLDPEKIAFNAVIETALAVKEALEETGLTGFCKTSGATGLHIYIPLPRRYTFETTRIAAKYLARLAHEKLPSVTSLERSPSRRQRKVYIDFLQNTRGQTLAAPYSARPRPGATVSAPLEWHEVKEGLTPSDFTIHTLPARIKDKDDLWKDFRKTKNSLSKLANHT